MATFNTKNSIVALTLTFALVGCGGGSSSSSSVDSTGGDITLTGKAIDGYLEGATVFLDINYNGELDSGEPSAITGENGDYTLSNSSIVDVCYQYSPLVVDVPVGAVDSDLGVVTEAYQLTTPPAITSFNDEDILNITPLTTLVWDTVEDALDELDDDMSCQRMIEESDLRSTISSSIEDQVNILADHYNISGDDIFADFIAEGNSDLHDEAMEIVDGLKIAFEEQTTLQALYPDSIVRITYLKGTDENGELNDTWVKREAIYSGDESTATEWYLTDDLEIDFLHYDSTNTVTYQNDLEYTKDIKIEWNEFYSKYLCIVTEEIMTDEDVSSGVSNTAYFDGDSYDDCEAGDLTSNLTSQSIVRRTVSGTNDSESVTNTWQYDSDDANPIDLSAWIDVEDSLDSLDGDALVVDLAAYSTDFYNEDDNGAGYWIRDWSTDEFIFWHNYYSYWSKKTYNDDGTYVLECGTSGESSMVVMDSSYSSCPF
ncbi:hypothetical protein ACXJY6_06835 [Vibrio sp. RC27]